MRDRHAAQGNSSRGAGLRRRQLLALLGLALPMGACGKKGSLRLPEEPPAESTDEETR